MHPAALFIAGAFTGYAVSQSRKAKKVKRDGGYMGRRALPGSAGDVGHRVLMLGPACSSWEILDRTKTDLLVRKAYIEGRLDGLTDPWRLTARAINVVAPKCHTPGKGIRNIGELDLYTSFFDSIMGLLAEDFPDAEDMAQIHAEFQTWHAQQLEVLSG